MTDPVLAAVDVSVVRGDEAVLDGVSISVDPAERVLVQGPSGSGKTTLFSVLGLLERPDAGDVQVDGRSADQMTERERARTRRSVLGYVYQDFKLVPDLTARENAALPQNHAGERDEERLDELFETLDISEVSDRRPAALSGGEKQRVATARALANDPDVVLADEPTGQLDPDTADRLMNLLCALQIDSGSSLVVVSHDRTLVDSFPRVCTLDGGSLSTST